MTLLEFCHKYEIKWVDTEEQAEKILAKACIKVHRPKKTSFDSYKTDVEKYWKEWKENTNYTPFSINDKGHTAFIKAYKPRIEKEWSLKIDDRTIKRILNKLELDTKKQPPS